MYKLKVNDEEISVSIENSDDGVLDGKIGDADFSARFTRISGNHLSIEVNGKRKNAFVADTPEGKWVVIDGTTYIIQDADEVARSRSSRKGAADGPSEVTPPMPAIVVTVLVKEGDAVEKGQGVIVVSAMKMETTLFAPFNGTVTGINAGEGDKVMPGDVLVDIEPPNPPEGG